jgi:hypothetical protein
MITRWNLEARDFTRIVKFPSGELPTDSPEEFILGGNLFGDPSPSRGCIDEVRFGSFSTPHPELPSFARYILAEEFEEEDDENVLRLSSNMLRYNWRDIQDTLLEEFGILEQIPKDAFLLLVGDEIIACSEVDTEDGYVAVLPDGRGVFGTEPGVHRPGDSVVVLNFPVVSFLGEDIRAESPGVLVDSTEGFPFSGTVLVDGELIGYDRIDGDFLSMPEYEPFGEERSRGLFRGRYGTEATDHYEGALVYLFPARYPDLYTPGSDAPELAYFSIGLEAPGAFFHELNWIEKRTAPGADLAVLARIGGRGGWEGDSAKLDDLFLFEDPADPKRRNFLLRQGDFIELRIFTRYAQGAFDPLDYSSNVWKHAPVLEALSVECVEPSRVFRHEEWR